MKKVFFPVKATWLKVFVGCLCGLLFQAQSVSAQHTLPIKGNVVKPTDSHIQYVGRISFLNPERPAWNYPGVQINTAFEGTSAKLICKPGSGYFMAQIDEAEPFKVAFRGQRDSVVTLCTALPRALHTVRLMYIIEGYELRPEFWGFVFDGPVCAAPALPARTIEFIGNSITCAYGNESTHEGDHFQYETENHYFGYAQLTARALGARAHIVARSGIGAYRNYNGPKTGNPESHMPVQYEYTGYALQASQRQQGGFDAEKWDFSRFQPDLVCINLGTNDLSTPNYDLNLLRQGYQRLLKMVRSHNPKAKIVFLCGSMLGGKQEQICQEILDEVAEKAHRDGDAEVYRFNFSFSDGSLKYGADWHPSIWQHEKMAAELTAYLRTLMQWF
ncbi:MAG: lipase [Prevotella sp.]|nr:lipase [Prevotella sp.]